MKVIVAFLFFSSVVLAPGNIYAQETYKDIIATGNNGLKIYLEKIPNGQEQFYGFKTRSEFADATIGKPYQVFKLSNEFYLDSNLSNKNYLAPASEWRIAVTVNNEPRVLLTVAKMNGVWKTVGIGAAGLATEIGEFEKKYPAPDQPGMILRVFQLDCDFFLVGRYNQSDDRVAYPFTSGKMALNKNPADTEGYPMLQLLPLIKNKIRNK